MLEDYIIRVDTKIDPDVNPNAKEFTLPIETLKKMEKASSFVAVGGVFVPLILGYIVAVTFLDFSTMQGIVIGLILKSFGEIFNFYLL